MRVFGSDIGCKNLAYCIFDIIDGKINIESWDLVDLRECICNRSYEMGRNAIKQQLMNMLMMMELLLEFVILINAVIARGLNLKTMTI